MLAARRFAQARSTPAATRGARPRRLLLRPKKTTDARPAVAAAASAAEGGGGGGAAPSPFSPPPPTATTTTPAAAQLLLPPLAPHTLRVHWRLAGDPECARGYGLHVWGDIRRATEWTEPLQPVAVGAAVGGAVFDVPLRRGGGGGSSSWVGVLVHRPPARQGLPHEEAVGIERLDVSGGLREVWLVGEAGSAVAVAAPPPPASSSASSSASPAAFFCTSPPDMAAVAPGSLVTARAHWATRDTILWRVPATTTTTTAAATATAAEGSAAPQPPRRRRRFFLHASATAALRLTPGGGVEGADASFELLPPTPPADKAGPPPTPRFSPATARFPHLFGCTELRLPPEAVARAGELLRCQLAVSAVDTAEGGEEFSPAGAPPQPSSRLLDATSVQTAGAVDDLFATDDSPLGDWSDPSTGGHRAFSVWAPTAQRVELLVWADGPDYSLDPSTGLPRSPAEARRAARAAPPSVAVDLCRGADGTPDAGVWSVPRPEAWSGRAYKLRVTAFCPWTNAVETCEATEPYAKALTADGERCVFVDLGGAEAGGGMAPEGWEAHRSPPLAQWTDVSVYELHIRDFSATDPTVPEHLRGKYLAFSPRRLGLPPAAAEAEEGGGQKGAAGDRPYGLSAGLSHLSSLARAGLTHVHLLPTFDFGSVPERPEDQLCVSLDELEPHAPDSDRQQAAVLRVGARDAFNWGYDPVHWGVPEGGYATDADGPSRTPQLREAVMALHGLGLRVVLDVVYNHTFASGPASEQSVLDKIVPGYYHRRAENGALCHSTCCNNTASEHRMMERLMVDDLARWAREYKVDGFRFDIMGHHFVGNLTKARAALDALTLEKDGVDGKAIYMYGEAWDFGEVALGARGRNASQHNAAGTRIGAFNDRLRDGALGGSPYHSPDSQGFCTGLFVDPNERALREAAEAGAAAAEAEAAAAAASSRGGGGGGAPSSSAAANLRRGLELQRLELLERTDWVRYSLAGNLADYALPASSSVSVDEGEEEAAAAAAGGAGRGSSPPPPAVLGKARLYHGNQPLCYGRHPCEHVAYVGCHDNETIFDQVAMRLPLHATAEDRARACRLALALSLLSVGVPFLHAGDDLLRSKSLDRDSYDSGDWFNAVDWTGEKGNNFGVGLPPAAKNGAQWPAKRALLREAARVAPSPAMRRAAARYVRALLEARYSSPLFRMSRAEDVCAQVRFADSAPPGVIVMVLASAPAPAAGGGAAAAAGTHDPLHASVVCVFNARPEPHECAFPCSESRALWLHPALEALRGGKGDDRDAALEGCFADAGARRLVVAARTAAVFVEDWGGA